MIFVILLTAVFVFMTAYSFISVKSGIVRLLFCSAYIAGIYFVWNPDASTKIANFFGMGRGLDFFMILLFVAIVNALVLIARQIHLQHIAITKLAKNIALGSARSQVIGRNA